MKILYVNPCYWGGGAEKIARQLYLGLKDKNIQTFFLAGRYQENIPKHVDVIYDTILQRGVSAALGIINHNVLFRTFRARKKIIDIIQKEKIDIVHFHNIHGNYLGPLDLKAIRKYCPNLVFTMHDMWLLTGCCPYAMECEKWTNLQRCYECTGNSFLKRGTKRASVYLRCKEKSFVNSNYILTSPSKWLINCCKKSYLKDEKIFLIPNGIDIDVFYPRDKNEVRKKYGIPLDKNILMFSAHKIDSPYKGVKYMLEALTRLKDTEKYCLLTVGTHAKEIGFPYEMINVGFVDDDNTMSELYAAADVFITTSMADNFPLTVLESMASGTPVLAFQTGGIPEAITEETGWIVKQGNSVALAEKIEDIFGRKEELISMGKQCRKHIEEKYSLIKMLDKYRELYEKILDEK